jgi:hypothetical protein
MKFFWRGKNGKKMAEAEARRLFRRVFLCPDGLRVLRVLLKDWHFFDPCETEAERVMNEYAKRFIDGRLGLAELYLATDLILDESIREKAEQTGDNYDGTDT